MISNNFELKIGNYRCFKELTNIGSVNRVNLVIGRNNSGKSSILDVLSFLCSNNHYESSHEINNTTIELTRILNEEEINKVIAVIQQTPFDRSLLRERKILLLREHYHDKLATFKLIGKRFSFGSFDDPTLEKYIARNVTMENVFSNSVLLRLNADRDIVPEESLKNTKWFCPSDGRGITKIIEALLNKEKMPFSIIEETVVQAFNRIAKPDISIERIVTKSDISSISWEIYLDEPSKGIISLSKSGSGIKTILSVLVFIHCLPHLLNHSVEDVIFAFEELENNLHPATQRNLYAYIEEMSKKLGFQYFLTTHSTVAIDFYSRLQGVNIIRVDNKDCVSQVTSIKGISDISDTIDILGRRASDLLQSNCIIWVEGPSDRIYLNRWITIHSNNTLIENVHYVIMFYGGKLLSHTSFEYLSDDAFINIMKINRHSVVIIDSDKAKEDDNVNQTKTRIKTECEGNGIICWITRGREIENYLSKAVLDKMYGVVENHELDLYQHISNSLENYSTTEAKNFGKNKVEFAKKAVIHIAIDDLEHLDLKEQLNIVCEKIRLWNGL